LVQRSDLLYSSREPSELSQWLCHDDSTINVVVVIIIIFYTLIIIIIINIIIINRAYFLLDHPVGLYCGRG